MPHIQKTKSWDKVLHRGWNYVPLTTERIREIEGKFDQIDKDILDKEYSGWSKRFEEILVKFQCSHRLTKKDEKWIDNRVRYQASMARLTKILESRIGRKPKHMLR